VRSRAVCRPRAGSDLAFLLRCELLGVLHTFTRDLDRFAAGSYALELVDRMVLGREPGREVYRLVDDALTLLDRGTPADALLRAFELHLLAATGYAPALDRCRGCGRELPTPAAYLVVARGGFVCRGCVPPEEPVRRLRPRPYASSRVWPVGRSARRPTPAGLRRRSW